MSAAIGNTLLQNFLTEMCRVKSVGGEGANNGLFNSPRQLTTDPIGRVVIADFWNDRICTYTRSRSQPSP